MTRARALLLVVGLWAAASCATMTPTQQRALRGGVLVPLQVGRPWARLWGGSPTLGAVVGGTSGTAAKALWEDTASAGPGRLSR
jgi:hypothetical protein